MKRVLFICAIIMVSLNYVSCTPQPLENTVQATGGEADDTIDPN